MQRAVFLQNSDVRAMLAWMRERFDSNQRFTHTYTGRKGGRSWRCNGLFEASQSYEWNVKDWQANKAELDSFRERLRGAVDGCDEESAVACSLEILRWGGVVAKNGVALEARRGHWLEELRQMTRVLTADYEPSRGDLTISNGSMCKMNAGFVKIYSVLLDYFVIYDGRVGGALGLLVRQFCEETGRATVPEPLKFAYGNPKEGVNAVSPKRRNPSSGSLRFPLLRPDPLFHTLQAMRASWLLRAALDPDPGPFSEGEPGFHEVAAGLFMVGYDLSTRCPPVFRREEIVKG